MAPKLKRLIDELGLAGTACYVTYRLLALSQGKAALYRYLLVAQPVPGTSLLPRHRGRSIIVRQLDPLDSMLLSLPLDRKVLLYRASQGAVCFGAFKQDEIIGCLWLCFAPYEEDEVRCRYHPHPPAVSAWDFDVYLKPEHRNGLGFARLWDEANEFLRQRGVAVSWSRISAFNPGSLASHSRLGARIVGSVTFLKIGKVQLMLASGPPYIHCSLNGNDVPSLVLLRQNREVEPVVLAEAMPGRIFKIRPSS